VEVDAHLDTVFTYEIHLHIYLHAFARQLIWYEQIDSKKVYLVASCLSVATKNNSEPEFSFFIIIQVLSLTRQRERKKTFPNLIFAKLPFVRTVGDLPSKNDFFI